MTEKNRALYAGGGLAALLVGGLVAKLILLPADTAASRADMHAVPTLGAPDAFGSAGHLTATVTPPSSPIIAVSPARAPRVADLTDAPAPARPAAHPPSAEAQATAPSARDDAASLQQADGPDAEPGQADSRWGRSYAAPPQRNGYYVWRRPARPRPTLYPPPPPRYAGYGPGPEVARPWDAGPPPAPDDDGPG